MTWRDDLLPDVKAHLGKKYGDEDFDFLDYAEREARDRDMPVHRFDRVQVGFDVRGDALNDAVVCELSVTLRDGGQVVVKSRQLLLAGCEKYLMFSSVAYALNSLSKFLKDARYLDELEDRNARNEGRALADCACVPTEIHRVS